MEDNTLREKALEAIKNGKLPTRSPDRIMGGPGCGEACAVCGETVRRSQIAWGSVQGRKRSTRSFARTRSRIGQVPSPPLSLHGVGVRVAHRRPRV